MFKPEVGKPCSFYHEGGAGERRWVIGWRFGIVREIPTRGAKFGRVRIEIPVRLWSYDPIKRTWTPRPNERVWVGAAYVNEPGDMIYHGPKAGEVWKERKEQKAVEQAKADKRARRLPGIKRKAAGL